MSPETIRRRLEDLPRWHYDEKTERLLRFDALADAETAARWAAQVIRQSQRLGRLPTVEIEGGEVRLWVRPARAVLDWTDVAFARQLDEALSRYEQGLPSRGLGAQGLRPDGRRPTLTSLAQLLASAEPAQVVPEAWWLIDLSMPVLRASRPLASLTRPAVGRSWREVARLLGQFDELLKAPRGWAHPSARLRPPCPSVSQLLRVCAARLESPAAEERAVLARVGERLEKLLELERKVTARARVAP